MLFIVTTLVIHSEVAGGLGSTRPDISLFGALKLVFGGLLFCDLVFVCVVLLLCCYGYWELLVAPIPPGGVGFLFSAKP